jgi:hypothetical protein
MNRIDDPQAILGSAGRAIDRLSGMVRSARSLTELRAIDLLLTCDIFEPLCNRDIPMTVVSALVWPTVAALGRQASLLHLAWKPTLSRGDWEGASHASTEVYDASHRATNAAR